MNKKKYLVAGVAVLALAAGVAMAVTGKDEAASAGQPTQSVSERTIESSVPVQTAPTSQVSGGEDRREGQFSTPTDNRRGADKPEDGGPSGRDGRGGDDRNTGRFSTPTDNRRGADKPED